MKNTYSIIFSVEDPDYLYCMSGLILIDGIY